MDTRYLLGLAVGIVLGWFALGTIYNLRRGEAMLRWMRGGLPKMGERTTLRWLGSSVAELVIERAKSPFRRFETLVVLAPRDVVFTWLWALARGRRDLLIFRGQLATMPRLAFELADAASWTGRMALADAVQRGWEGGAYNPTLSTLQTQRANLRLELRVPQGFLAATEAALPGYLALMERLAPRLVRLQVRRDPPSLEIHVPFPDPRHTDPAAYFDTLRELAQLAMGAERV